METYSDQITEVLKSQLDAAIQKGIVTFQDQISPSSRRPSSRTSAS